jgi:2'-5' RNA ligase
MKTLKEFMSNKKYISAEYDVESQQKLRAWCVRNGFDLSVTYSGNPQKVEEFDFHSTIFYSNNDTIIKNGVVRINPIEVSIDSIALFGDDNDIPVFVISSADILNIRKSYADMGVEDDWGGAYTPHISLSYDREFRDVSNLELPNFKPKFDKIIIKDIDN